MSVQPLPADDGMVDSPVVGDESGRPSPADAARLRQEELALLRRNLDGVAVVLAGPANVVMQLAWLEVGHGVAKSDVVSGQLFKHPFKRYRTTIGYLMVAQFGSDELRSAYREAVNGSHRSVRSGPGEEVSYNAFDRDLQLWVASCIFYGARDIATRMHRPLTAAEEEVLLRAGARWGTTLQVPPEMWHRDMDAFRGYWEAGLRRARFDDVTAPYLRALLDFKFLARPLRPFVRPLAWVNVGFVPAELRDGLGLEWSERDQRAHDRLLRTLGAVSRRLPAALRMAPAMAMLWNIRLRRRLGRPLV